MRTRREILQEHYAALFRRTMAWTGLVSLLSTVFVATPAQAAQITTRKVTISSSSNAGSNATTQYVFNFTVPTTGTPILSWEAQACTTALGTCTTPTGFSQTSSTLGSQPTNLGAASGWTINTATSGSLRIVNAANGTNPSGAQTVTISNVQNPTTTGTFFLRITTYSAANWTGALDTGTVAASTANQMQVTADVSESLSFCVGTSYSSGCTGTGPVALAPNPLTTASISNGTSVFAASTNGLGGFAVSYYAGQFTNGTHNFNNAFTSAGGASAPGTEEFGLRAALTTGSGGQVAAAYSGTNYAWNPATTTPLADSNNAPVDTNVFTVTYGANVNPTTPYGSYSTTFNYVCTPTY